MTCQWYTTDATETSRPMKIRALGHVSLFVRDLEATRRFYRDLLGLAETGTGKDGRIVFFSAGARHHDLSCELARAPGPGRRGLVRALAQGAAASRRHPRAARRVTPQGLRAAPDLRGADGRRRAA